jgi:hypothetical protein
MTCKPALAIRRFAAPRPARARLAMHLVRGEAGFTIMELLMATFIGMIVLGTMWGAVAVQGRGAATQMGLADAQLASRGAGEVLLQDLRMAGFGMLGASKDSDIPPIEVTSVGAVTEITLRGAYTNTQTTIAASTPAGSSVVTVLPPPANTAFLVNELVLIDSGLNSEIKTITSVSTAGGNLEIGLSSPLAYQYPLGPNVIQIEEVEYQYDGAILRRNGDVLVDNVPGFDLRYIDQAGNETPEPGDDLRSVIIELDAQQSSNLPGNQHAHASIDTEVNVRNLAFRATLD